MNGTFDLAYAGDDEWIGSACSDSQPYYACAYGTLKATLVNTGEEWLFSVMYGDFGLTRIVWQKSYGLTRPTCEELAGTVDFLEQELENPHDQTHECDGSGATVTVSIPELCEVGEGCENREGYCGQYCINANAPESLEIEIPASWTNQLCTNCNSEYAGIFIVDRHPTFGCLYEYTNGSNFTLRAEIKPYNGVVSLVVEARIGACGCAQAVDVTRWVLPFDVMCEDYGDCHLSEPTEVPFCCHSSPGCGFGIKRCRWDGLLHGGAGGCTFTDTCPGSGLGLDPIVVTAA